MIVYLRMLRYYSPYRDLGPKLLMFWNIVSANGFICVLFLTTNISLSSFLN